MGVTVEEWQSMEQGEKEMSNTFLIRLCKTFGVSSDDILFYHKKVMDMSPVLTMRTLTEEEQEKIKVRMAKPNSGPIVNEP